jgi:hypothetical protein
MLGGFEGLCSGRAERTFEGTRWLVRAAMVRRCGGRDLKEAETLRPLPVVLALAASGSLVAALVPGFNGARCIRRAVVLAVVAVYAWMVV